MKGLPKEVRDEIAQVIEDMIGFETPPDGAFTLREYYAIYLDECGRRGVKEEFRVTIDVIRTRLNKKVSSGELRSMKFNSSGNSTMYYWVPKK